MTCGMELARYSAWWVRILLSIFIAASTLHVSAANWDGTYSENWDGTGGFLNSQDNWGGSWWVRNWPDAVGATATFPNGATRYTVNVNGTYTLGTMEFTSSNNYTLTNGTLLLRARSGNAVIQTTSSGNAAINSALVLSNGLTITNSGTGTLTLAGAISQTNTSGITKTGSGTTILSGSNSYTGTTTVNSGVLIAANNNALGATNNGTTISNGAALYLSNNITITGEALTISGTGISNTGALRNISGTNTYAGSLTLNNAARINADINTQLTVSGNINGANNNLTVGGAGNTILSGTITNSTGTFTKDGTGTVTLSGTNTYGGATTISNGTLRVSTLANAGSSSSIGTNANIILAGSNSAAAIFDYTGGNVTMNRNFIATNGGGTINMASNTVVTHTGSASGSGTIELSKGTLVLSNTGTPNAFAPGAIKVDSGATLQIAADNQIGNSTGLILNGGTFRIGTSSTQFSDQLGTLTVSADSVIDLGSWTGGSTPRQLSFADSSSITWTGTLTISNWQGVARTSSDVAEILFGVGGLSSSQLSQVIFANQGINGGALIGGNGELVPIPEPKVYAAAAVLLLSILWIERRRIKLLLNKRRGV